MLFSKDALGITFPTKVDMPLKTKKEKIWCIQYKIDLQFFDAYSKGQVRKMHIWKIWNLHGFWSKSIKGFSYQCN